MSQSTSTNSDGEEEGEDEQERPFYTTGTRGPDREDMVASYLPNDEDWSAKTVLELTDPGAVSSLYQFHRLFPEVEDLQPVIDEFLYEFMKSRTSVGGQSRQEYLDIFMSMFGGHPDSKRGTMLAEALAGDLYDED